MLLKNQIEIKEWLNKYQIKKYELIKNKEYGYVVNVNGSVDLTCNELKSIEGLKNLVNLTINDNYINLEENKKLGNLKKIKKI